jgi:hypothetical protein
MRQGRPYGLTVSRRLVAVLAGALVATLAIAATLGGGAARAQTSVVPSNTSPPTITGTAAVGKTLTAGPGAWSGTTPMTFKYQWQRCDSSGNNCTSIPGETTNHRQLVSDDVGHRLRVRVTATNASGSASATSAASDVVSGGGSGAPVSTKEPTITGSAVQGQILQADHGTWSGATPITYKYQWLRCDSLGGNCAQIAGETSASRQLDSGDVGKRLRVRVTATNGSGSGTAQSNATNVVTASGGGSGAPVSKDLPQITGVAAQGETLVSSNGTWTGATPITYTYQWLRCDANGGACATIPGETKSNRTLTDGDVGHRMRIRVTAKNNVGSATVQSEATAVVTGSGGGGGGGPLPDGAVKLPSGKYSIPVTSVSLPVQLVVDKVKFAPNPIRSRTVPLTVKVHIVDTRGYVVRDALVFVRSVPLVTTTPPETPTAQDGWVTLQLFPRPDFPLNGKHVQFFARVRKAGDTLLVGVGSRRLVQVRTAKP